MIRTALIVGAVAILFGALGYVLFAPGSSSALDDTLTEVTDPAAAQSMAQVIRPSVAVSENYVGDKIRLIRGAVKNTSEKAIRLIEVKMQFFDYNGKPIHEGVHQVFEPKQRPLEPGGERPFEIAFDNLPRTWNYQSPATQVVKVGY